MDLPVQDQHSVKILILAFDRTKVQALETDSKIKKYKHSQCCHTSCHHLWTAPSYLTSLETYFVPFLKAPIFKNSLCDTWFLSKRKLLIYNIIVCFCLKDIDSLNTTYLFVKQKYIEHFTLGKTHMVLVLRH